MSRRRQARELLLGCLYAHFSTGQEAEAVFESQAARMTYDARTQAYALNLFRQILAHAEDIDRTIRDAAANWDFGRIGAIEKNILRAAIAELWFCPDTPAAVIIDEAVELAKAYADPASTGFINGILDCVYKNHEKVPSGEGPPKSAPKRRSPTDAPRKRAGKPK